MAGTRQSCASRNLGESCPQTQSELHQNDVVGGLPTGQSPGWSSPSSSCTSSCTTLPENCIWYKYSTHFASPTTISSAHSLEVLLRQRQGLADCAWGCWCGLFRCCCCTCCPRKSGSTPQLRTGQLCARLGTDAASTSMTIRWNVGLQCPHSTSSKHTSQAEIGSCSKVLHLVKFVLLARDKRSGEPHCRVLRSVDAGCTVVEEE